MISPLFPRHRGIITALFTTRNFVRVDVKWELIIISPRRERRMTKEGKCFPREVYFHRRHNTYINIIFLTNYIPRGCAYTWEKLALS